jgi:predicted ATP-grasp superfamily ATP-dependent carboligase
VPLVADFFADADTRDLAASCRKVDGDLRRGFQWATLGPALEALAEEAPSPLLGVLCGAGFEDRPGLLAAISERWPLLGNDAATVERVKNPAIFFPELARLGIPHPRTVSDPAVAEDGWLAKRQGGAGGSHIVPSREAVRRRAAGRHYFQEKLRGRPVSALFVGSGARACVLGFSEQWAAPIRQSPWRYGGAVQPADLSPGLKARLTGSVEAVAAAFGLQGLGSADFLIDGGNACLLEINPRPGATIDIFDCDAAPLLHLHVQAVLNGRLPMAPLPSREATAAAIVYAPAPVEMVPGMAWPDWTSDIPKLGERIEKDRPLCTVLARASSGPDARRLVEERRDMILKACARQKEGQSGRDE